MSKKSKKNNGLIKGIGALFVLVLALVIFSPNSSDLFRGQFFVNQDSPAVREAAKEIDVEVPESASNHLVIQKAEPTPFKIFLDNPDKSPLAVFKITTRESSETVLIDRLVANIAGTGVKAQNLRAEAFLGFNPFCGHDSLGECAVKPEPIATFTPQQQIINPEAENDQIIEFTAQSTWGISLNDPRFTSTGNSFYLAVYGDLLPAAGATTDQIKSIATGLKYLGNQTKPFNITGMPTEYQIVNVY